MTLAKVENGKITEILILAIFMAITACPITNFAQRATRIPLNEFGLLVIRSKRMYKKVTALDISKKMVMVNQFVSPLKTCWFYATTNNFTHQVLYKNPIAYLRLPAALALQKVADTLKTIGYGIELFDAYRPYSVTKKMWQTVPDDNYAADPAKGSGHNRGIAVDLTLVDLKTGMELAMPTPFDDFSDTAHHNFMGLSPNVLQNRALLKTTMENYGFIALPTEWWHYSLPNPKMYDLLDLDFYIMQKLIK